MKNLKTYKQLKEWNGEQWEDYLKDYMVIKVKDNSLIIVYNLEDTGHDVVFRHKYHYKNNKLINIQDESCEYTYNLIDDNLNAFYHEMNDTIMMSYSDIKSILLYENDKLDENIKRLPYLLEYGKFVKDTDKYNL